MGSGESGQVLWGLVESGGVWWDLVVLVGPRFFSPMYARKPAEQPSRRAQDEDATHAAKFEQFFLRHLLRWERLEALQDSVYSYPEHCTDTK